MTMVIGTTEAESGRSWKGFGIPLIDWLGEPLPLVVIEFYIQRFIVCARAHPNEQFFIMPIGQEHKNFRQDIIAEKFKYAPDNCYFPEQWETYLPKKNFWE